jgi:hypothetical protein
LDLQGVHGRRWSFTYCFSYNNCLS